MMLGYNPFDVMPATAGDGHYMNQGMNQALGMTVQAA